MTVEQDIGWELQGKKPREKIRGSQHIRRVEKHEIKGKIYEPPKAPPEPNKPFRR